MSHGKMLASSPSNKGFQLGLQPAPAWTVIVSFILFSAICILAGGGAGKILRLVFPGGAFVIALFLYRRYPILYVGFTWWLWFLSPWVRRLIDYRSGWVNPSPVLLAPHLATLVTAITFFRYLPKYYRADGLPFFLSFTGVVYACLLGLINGKYGYNQEMVNQIFNQSSITAEPVSVLIETLAWITPIFFGFHVFVTWQHYPEYKQNMQRIFLWGVLLMGIYGILQFLIAPEWDKFWLKNAGANSFGIPEPLGIRVFGTMNSPGPFAGTMMTGLLLLLASQGTLRFGATAVGYLTFLLTMVRSAWGAWFVGLLMFFNSAKPKTQMRLIITVLVVGLLAFPLTTIEPFAKVINERMETFSNIQEDGSFKARSHTYGRAFSAALVQPIGNGLGLPGLDSAVMDIFIIFGWLGAIPYVGGIIMLVFKIFQCDERRFDPFMGIACALTIARISSLGFGNSIAGVDGVQFWCLIGFVLAGHKYYQHQRVMAMKGGCKS